MPAQWPFTGGNHQWNCPNRGSFQFYQDALAQGVVLTDLWYGEFPQNPSNINSGLSAVTSWKQAVPGLKVMRQLFNQWCFWDRFNNIDTGRYVYQQAEDFVQALAAQGFETVWCLMDGPSQRSGTAEPGIVTYWTSYPGISQPSDWLLDDTWNKIHASQMNSWTRLINYLKLPGNESVLAATRGFEAINEPDSYRVAGDATGNIEFAMTKYVDHVLAIHDRLMAEFPAVPFEFYVGGWRYSSRLDELNAVFLTKYGKTAYQAIKDAVGSKLVWSIHAYSHWTPNTDDFKSYAARVGSTFQFAIDNGDRVAITETNQQSESADNLASSPRQAFIMSRSMEKWARDGISIMWWPLFNWADGRIITARGALPQMGHQNAYGAFMRQAMYNSNPDYMTGNDTGIRGPQHVIPVSSLTLDPSDPDYGTRPPSTLTKFAITIGGRGVAVCQPDEDANNYMFGGNGRNILYASQANDDNLNLGRGGGVARCYGGYNKVNVVEAQNLVYAGSQWTLVSGYTGQMTVVVDPAATTHIVGWSPRKGDKISFRRAFTTQAQLTAAMSTAQSPNAGYPNERNLIVTFPAGGSLTMWGSAGLESVLGLHNMDFTSGWYATGWTEPADYSVSDFDLPIVNPPPAWPVEAGGLGYLKSSARLLAFTRAGQPLSGFWRNGDST